MIVIPAYAVIVRGWFGAWPMRLDWERPWQVIYLSPELHPRAWYAYTIIRFDRRGLYVCVMKL